MKTTPTNKFKKRPPATKRSHPDGPSAHLIGALRGKIRVTGDLTSTTLHHNIPLAF